jgi:hypothetical protein
MISNKIGLCDIRLPQVDVNVCVISFGDIATTYISKWSIRRELSATDRVYIRRMPDRSRLYVLIDTLPEAAIPAVQAMLERFQTWPPSAEPSELRAIRTARLERMRQTARPRTMGGWGGVGSYRAGQGGPIEYGSQNHGHWEGGTFVTTRHIFHTSHKLVIEERLRLIDDGGTLLYTEIIEGPNETVPPRELAFDVKPK